LDQSSTILESNDGCVENLFKHVGEVGRQLFAVNIFVSSISAVTSLWKRYTCTSIQAEIKSDWFKCWSDILKLSTNKQT